MVDAALRTVLRAGVRPDMVCTIDPESPDRFFENLDVTDLAWCCNRITRPWVLEHCAKRVYYYGFFEKRWNQILDENMEYLFPDIPSGGCVSATAFALGAIWDSAKPDPDWPGHGVYRRNLTYGGN